MISELKNQKLRLQKQNKAIKIELNECLNSYWLKLKIMENRREIRKINLIIKNIDVSELTAFYETSLCLACGDSENNIMIENIRICLSCSIGLDFEQDYIDEMRNLIY